MKVTGQDLKVEEGEVRDPSLLLASCKATAPTGLLLHNASSKFW
jgi:hypothetical protein